jgi:hypothetical protein
VDAGLLSRYPAQGGGPSKTTTRKWVSRPTVEATGITLLRYAKEVAWILFFITLA